MKYHVAGSITKVAETIAEATGTIPITGIIRDAAGNLFNGLLRFVLSYGACQNFVQQNLVVAAEVSFPVTNGALPASARITPNDVLQPANTTYTAQYVNPRGTVVAQNVFYITGAGDGFDIGKAMPTPVTTSNISFDVDHVTGVESITADAVFTDVTLVDELTASSGTVNVLGSDFLTANTATFGRVNHVRFPDLFPGTTASEKIINAMADLPITGGIVDARGLEGAQTWSTCPFAGLTKQVTLILGSATYTVTQNCTVPDNCHLVLTAGSILSVNAGVTLTTHLNPETALTQHFTGPGTVIITKAEKIHTRWFDDGTHSGVALQRAIDAVGPVAGGAGTVALRAGVVWIDDILTLTATAVIDRKALTIDCGGICSFNATGPGPFGGLLWNGAADVPMIEVKGVQMGVVIQNCRFYGNIDAAKRPRSAISLVNSASTGIGNTRIMIRNVHIGGLFGDPPYDLSDVFSFNHGIYIGDPYDGGDSGNNDEIMIDAVTVQGITGTGVRQGGHQNTTLNIRHLIVYQCQYGFQATGKVDIQSALFTFCTGAVIHMPLNDDYGFQVFPIVIGQDLLAELCARYILFDGNGIIEINGGGFQLTNQIAADKIIVSGENSGSHTVHLQKHTFQDLDAIGAYKIRLRAPFGGGAFKSLRLHGWGTFPTIEMETWNGFDLRMIDVDMSPLDTTLFGTAGSNQFPYSRAVLSGWYANPGNIGQFDSSRYQISNRALRVGEVQNGGG